MREELNPVLAKKMLDEWNKIQRMKFWQYLAARFEGKRQQAKDDWEGMEVGTAASPLMEKWLRLQGRAQAFKEAQSMPDKLAQDCENATKGHSQ